MENSTEENEIALDDDYVDSVKSALFPKKPCPPGRFISAINKGNLGNVIWEYMSLYVIAQKFGGKFNLTPYISYEMKETVETTFER